MIPTLCFSAREAAFVIVDSVIPVDPITIFIFLGAKVCSTNSAPSPFVKSTTTSTSFPNMEKSPLGTEMS